MNSSIRYVGGQDEPEEVYYNATVINANTQPSSQFSASQIQFYDARDIPILKDASLYKLEVQNFALDGAVKNIPIFIPIIQTIGGVITDIKQTIYVITLGWTNGTSYVVSQKAVFWQPQEQSPEIPVPIPGTPVQSDSPYYYCYDFQWFVSLLNLTLRQAYDEIVAYANANLGGFGGTMCPFYSYDSETRKFSISQDVNTCTVPFGDAINTTSNTYGYSPYYPALVSPATNSSAGVYIPGEYTFLGVNSNLNALMANLSSTYNGYNQFLVPGLGAYYPEYQYNMPLTSTAPIQHVYSGFSFQDTNSLLTNVGVLLNPFTGQTDITPVGEGLGGVSTASYLVSIEQESSVDTLWTPVSTWVITTNNIPIINENVSNPVDIGSANTGTNQGGSSAFSRIVLETPYDPQQMDYIFYAPSVETYTSLSPSKNPLRTIDFQMWWRNRLTNKLVPLTLPNSGSATLRLRFKKRDSQT